MSIAMNSVLNRRFSSSSREHETIMKVEKAVDNKSEDVVHIRFIPADLPTTGGENITGCEEEEER